MKKTYMILSIIFISLIFALSILILHNINKEKKYLKEVYEEEKQRKQIIEEKRRYVLETAKKLEDGYFYDEAINILSENESITNEETEKLTLEIKSKKESLIKYEGHIHHIFFHSLIIDTKKAFDKDNPKAQGYNMWMTTVDEFEKMLIELWKRGYVLINIKDTVDFSSGKGLPKDIYLPKGKTPLIISQDDVNYYKYMEGSGFAKRLTLDENGEVAAVVVTDKRESISRKGDVVPILDDFVKEHPDFSYRGAKGILALTGFEGTLGYRTDTPKGDEKDARMEELMRVINKLKETGWLFASHSYTHNQYFANLSVTMEQMKYDADKWEKKVGSIIGDTEIYISPFGYKMQNEDKRYRYLVSKGFKIFCYVGVKKDIEYYSDNIMEARFNMDGYQMIYGKEHMKKYYCDPDLVIDKTRPKLKIKGK